MVHILGIGGSRRDGPAFTDDWSLTGEDGQLTLTFAVNEAALDEAQQLDGRYALVTNSELSADEMPTAFKRQSSV